MKRNGLAIACCAGAVSLALHAGGFATLSSETPQSLSGGPTQLAMIGNSFEDAIAGSVTGATDPMPTMPVETFTRLPEAAEPATVSSARTVETIRPTPSAAAAAPVLRNVAPTVAAQAVPNSALPPDDAATADHPTVPKAAAIAPMASVTARDVPAVQTPDATTVRPMARPTATRSAQARHPPSAAQGSATETTRAGDTQDVRQGNATRSQQGQEGQSASDGRAAARYPQLVNRHLSRLRRPNARFDGAAIVSFTIAETGGLAAASVARSSGDAQFDRLALAHIQRAAPFPRPPAGAQRQFYVTIRSR